MFRLTFASLAVASAEMSWEEWKMFHDKAYNGGEDQIRQQIYEANVQKIEEHNALNASWTMGVNWYADLTKEEFRAKYTGKQPALSDDIENVRHVADEVDVPTSIDWVDQGVVNPIRDQQGSDCWAFSAVGALESAVALATGTLPKLSEQQLCDCSDAGSCEDGGEEDDALVYYKTHGACARKTYPETGEDGKCKYNTCDKVVAAGTVTKRVWVDTDAQSWKSAIAKQPITCSVDSDNLQFYRSGVVSDHGGVVTTKCGGSVDHAVVAVGYGTDGQDYFKIRNSWGKSWGENGYVRLAQTGGKKGVACIYRWQGSYPKIGSGISV